MSGTAHRPEAPKLPSRLDFLMHLIGQYGTIALFVLGCFTAAVYVGFACRSEDIHEQAQATLRGDLAECRLVVERLGDDQYEVIRDTLRALDGAQSRAAAETFQARLK